MQTLHSKKAARERREGILNHANERTPANRSGDRTPAVGAVQGSNWRSNNSLLFIGENEVKSNQGHAGRSRERGRLRRYRAH